MSVAATWAREHGLTTIACASTGNLANSVAAYAAHAGLRAVVVVPSDLEPAKMIGTSIFRPTIISVEGSYDDVNRLCTELADCVDWGFCNLNLRAYYSEGSKTLTFETAEQLGWRLPDEIIVPVASGCQFVKHRKAAGELIDLGLVDRGSRLPRLTGAQALGCSPVATAFAEGETAVVPVRPSTIARSIAIGNPSDGADCCASRERPAGWSRASPRRNWSKASSCSRRARASSPRLPAGSPWRCCESSHKRAAGRATRPWSPTSPVRV